MKHTLALAAIVFGASLLVAGMSEAKHTQRKSKRSLRLPTVPASYRILDELLPEKRLAPAQEKQPEKALADRPTQSHEEPGRPNVTQGQPAPQTPNPSDSISMDR